MRSFREEGWLRSATSTRIFLRYSRLVMTKFILVLLTISIALLFSDAGLVQSPGARAQQTGPGAASADNQDDEFYVCPMHPDVMSDEPGKCPKCAMTLVRTPRPEMAEYEVQLTTIPAVVKPGEAFRLTFFISHPKTAAPVKE